EPAACAGVSIRVGVSQREPPARGDEERRRGVEQDRQGEYGRGHHSAGGQETCALLADCNAFRGAAWFLRARPTPPGDGGEPTGQGERETDQVDSDEDHLFGRPPGDRRRSPGDAVPAAEITRHAVVDNELEDPGRRTGGEGKQRNRQAPAVPGGRTVFARADGAG